MPFLFLSPCPSPCLSPSPCPFPSLPFPSLPFPSCPFASLPIHARPISSPLIPAHPCLFLPTPAHPCRSFSSPARPCPSLPMAPPRHALTPLSLPTWCQAQGMAYRKAKHVRISIAVSCSQSQAGHSSSQPIRAQHGSLNQLGAWQDSAWPNMFGPCVQPISDQLDSAQPITVCILPIPNLPGGASRPVTAMGFAPLFSANRGTACVPSTNHKPGFSRLGQSWCDLGPLNQSRYLICALPATRPRAACALPACAACILPGHRRHAACSLATPCPDLAGSLPAPCLQPACGHAARCPAGLLTLSSFAGGDGAG